MVFNAILLGRQRGQKLQCLYENPMANNSFSNISFTQLMNRNFTILGSRFNSPRMKHVAWLLDTLT